MSSARERKAVAAFAAAQGAASPTTDTNATANAALARAAADSSSSGSSSSSSGGKKSVLRFLPYVALFVAVFLAVSLASTGTLNYGLDSPAALRAFTKQVDAVKIRVQESAGLREPAQATRPANTGYGGVTPKKKKSKKKKAAAGANPATAGAGAAGISPSMMGLSGGDAAPDDDEEEEKAKAVVITPRPLEHDFGALYLSVEELAKYDGADGGPIFLAIYGRLFDVTEGRNFYGKGASYSGFAARDASRAFATNCYNSPNLFDLRGLSAEQRKVGSRIDKHRRCATATAKGRRSARSSGSLPSHFLLVALLLLLSSSFACVCVCRASIIGTISTTRTRATRPSAG